MRGGYGSGVLVGCVWGYGDCVWSTRCVWSVAAGDMDVVSVDGDTEYCAAIRVAG